jgi:HEAT repeat protein
LILGLGGCAPPACSDGGERVMRKDVQLIVEDDGAVAEAARARLVARGREAVLVLETGLYAANAPARRRIVRALAEIGSAEAAPILAHLAAHDPDPDVRQAAENASQSLRSAP